MSIDGVGMSKRFHSVPNHLSNTSTMAERGPKLMTETSFWSKKVLFAGSISPSDLRFSGGWRLRS